MPETRKQVIRRHTDPEVYQRSFDAAMRMFFLSKEFPSGETFSLISQCRRSSRSVAANITEAWRKRKYPAGLYPEYDKIIGMLAKLATNPAHWPL